jgi:predicted NBD/HSP70 family sugar kinase
MSELIENDLDALTLDIVAQAADAGDLLATQELKYVSEIMGLGIANLINAFNPHLIVLSGPVAYAIQSFLPIIRTSINAQIMYPLARAVDLKLSSLRAEACVMGAIAIVLDQFHKTLSW